MKVYYQEIEKRIYCEEVDMDLEEFESLIKEGVIKNADDVFSFDEKTLIDVDGIDLEILNIVDDDSDYYPSFDDVNETALS